MKTSKHGFGGFRNAARVFGVGLLLCCGGSLGHSSDPRAFKNSVGMRMIQVFPGPFLRGKPGEQQRTLIEKGFHLAAHEVTQAQWERVMGTKPWRRLIAERDEKQFRALVYEDPRSPAVYMGWAEAYLFCLKLGKLEGRSYRLPFAAEWEYACRAGTRTRYSYGDSPDGFGTYGWDSKMAQGVLGRFTPARPMPVGQMRPNGWGFHDMHGNVEELCLDFESAARTWHLSCGGSVYDSRNGCYSYSRGGATVPRADIGFRVLLDPAGHMPKTLLEIPQMLRTETPDGRLWRRIVDYGRGRVSTPPFSGELIKVDAKYAYFKPFNRKRQKAAALAKAGEGKRKQRRGKVMRHELRKLIEPHRAYIAELVALVR